MIEPLEYIHIANFINKFLHIPKELDQRIDFLLNLYHITVPLIFAFFLSLNNASQYFQSPNILNFIQLALAFIGYSIAYIRKLTELDLLRLDAI